MGPAMRRRHNDLTNLGGIEHGTTESTKELAGGNRSSSGRGRGPSAPGGSGRDQGASTRGRHFGPASRGVSDVRTKLGDLTERHFADSDDLCRRLSEDQGGACLLAFSRGKDSLAAWIQLRRFFPRVAMFFRYQVPGGPLGFEEDSLRYFEDAMGTEIHRIPHPSLVRQMLALTFQAPENVRHVIRMALPKWEYQQSNDAVRVREGLMGRGGYVGNGTRAVDSPQRWRSMKVHGVCNHKAREFYPVFDWRMDRLVDEIRASGIKLPVDYKLWGRTFDGLDHRFLADIKERFPADYARILRWFPLAELEIFRAQMRKGVARHDA